ncbi:MAG: hypothetical protein AAGK70_09840 [Pseudomonadota bacterium]
MSVCKTVAEAVASIQSFDGQAEDFELLLCESFFDPVGVNISIVTDAILEKGWMPLKVEQRSGHRHFTYQNAPD